MKINEIITEGLNEVEEIDYISHKKGKQHHDDPTNKDDLERLGAVIVGRMKSGHTIYVEKSKDSSSWTSYYALSPTGLVDLALGGYEKKNVLSDLNLYAINKANTLKAHDFYHFLITKLNKVLVADRQSPGGHAVWKQMQKFHKDINIHGWLKGKPVNIDMNDDEYTHAPEHSDYLSDVSPETSDAMKMQLVASKK